MTKIFSKVGVLLAFVLSLLAGCAGGYRIDPNTTYHPPYPYPSGYGYPSYSDGSRGVPVGKPCDPPEEIVKKGTLWAKGTDRPDRVEERREFKAEQRTVYGAGEINCTFRVDAGSSSNAKP